MSVVPTIFEAFGGVNRLAEATGTPQQTASEWLNRSPPDIPPWRRPAVLGAARKLKEPLPPEALTYLASTQRIPRARPESAAA